VTGTVAGGLMCVALGHASLTRAFSFIFFFLFQTGLTAKEEEDTV